MKFDRGEIVSREEMFCRVREVRNMGFYGIGLNPELRKIRDGYGVVLAGNGRIG